MFIACPVFCFPYWITYFAELSISMPHFQVLEFSMTSKISFEPFVVNLHSYPHSSRQLLICFMSLKMFFFWVFHINGKIYREPFFVQLLSLSKMSLRFIHVVTCISDWLLFLSKSYFILWSYCNLFVHSSWWAFELLVWVFSYKSLGRYCFSFSGHLLVLELAFQFSRPLFKD